MEVILTGDNIEMTEAIESYTNKKLDRLTKRGSHITKIHVVFSADKLEQKAHATMHISGSDIAATATDTNLYAAIDLLVDKLVRQLSDHNGRY
jgi:putative sigma-54 modulation protein